MHKRLQKELQDFQKECPEAFTGGPSDPQNIYKWDAILFGPKNSPYEGG